MIAHWDGRKLRLTRPFHPSSPADRGVLYALSAVSPDDVWAVGASVRSGPFILHWDGRGWQSVPAPQVTGEAGLYDVKAFSASNVWAVGSVGAWPTQRAFVMRWDGQEWHTWQLAGPASSLVAIGGTSPLDLWATGGIRENAPQMADQAALAEHWDGHAWRRSLVFLPDLGGEGNYVIDIDSVAARSPSDVWALASDYTGGGYVLHWNGERQSVSYRTKNDDLLFDIAPISPREVWAVGERLLDRTHRPLLAHWNGTSWRIEKTALDTLRGDALSRVSALSANDIWAVGDHLIARYAC